MIQMDEHRYDQVYFGGKGLSKGKRQTTGKSFGRRTNPTGPDGEIMKCTICDSTEHFRAMCPRNQSASSSGTGFVNPNFMMTSEHTHVCPLADTLFYKQVETNAFSTGERSDVENQHSQPSSFHVPEMIPAQAYDSFLRAPTENRRDLHEPLLTEATYPNGPSLEHLAMLTARANLIQSGIEAASQRTGAPIGQARRPEVNPTSLLEQFPALQAFGNQREQYQAQRNEWRETNHRNIQPPESRGPGIHANSSMSLPNIVASHPTLIPMIPQQTAGPTGAPNAEATVTTFRRAEAARQLLASQISSPTGLGDPAQRLALSSEAYEINRVRAATAVFAVVAPLQENWVCAVCLEEYQTTDSVSVSNSIIASTQTA